MCPEGSLERVTSWSVRSPRFQNRLPFRRRLTLRTFCRSVIKALTLVFMVLVVVLTQLKRWSLSSSCEAVMAAFELLANVSEALRVTALIRSTAKSVKAFKDCVSCYQEEEESGALMSVAIRSGQNGLPKPACHHSHLSSASRRASKPTAAPVHRLSPKAQ